MPGVVQNLVCDLNERLRITDTVTADGTSSGAPVNISGWALKVVIHKLPGDGLELLNYTTGGGAVTIPVGSDGRLVFVVPNVDVRTLGPGTFTYYVARTDAGNEADLTRGRFTVRAV